MTWRRNTRRAFLVSAPLSVPVWLTTLALAAAGETGRRAMRPLLRLWNAPPVRRYGYYRY